VSRALLIVVSGPAGSGKTTLCGKLTDGCPDAIRRVITCTTRAPRPGEVDGVDYHFLTRAQFEQQIAEGVFLEHALVHGNLYGPRAADVAKHLSAGFDALLNVDVQGAATIRAKGAADPRLADALVTVFIRVQDRAELRRRLTGRGTDPADEIDRRVVAAEEELRHASSYQHIIESASREDDFAALRRIYLAEKARRP
jgi:guanylate kinase